VLDNPVWNALTTVQQSFAERDGDAARFPPEITGLAGVRVPTEAAWAALARLLGPGGVTGIVGGDAPGGGLEIVDEAPCAQMVFEGTTPQDPGGHEPLGPDDAAAMLALATATRPGPFGTRTGELGTFLGIRADGQLIAMAGQRMRLPGLIEISGVCTDPAPLGRGHAARLMAAQLARIAGEGAAAFLHVRADNSRAIAIYERLGFRIVRTFPYTIVRAQPAPA